jgi:hypothetical protein
MAGSGGDMVASYRFRLALREYAKAGAGILAGMVFLAYLELLFVAHNNYFCVPKAEAAAKAQLEEAYNRIMVNGLEE